MTHKARRRTTGMARPLSSEQVVRVGLELLDEAGPAGLSMRVLADRLGTYPSTVYWHVGDKNQLLAALVSAVLGEMTLPDSTATSWDRWLRTAAHSYRQALHRHPHVGPLVASQLTVSPLSLRVSEEILGVLAGAGFHGGDLADAYNAFVGSVVGWVSVELSANPAATTDWEQEFADALRTLSAEEYPTIVSNLDTLADEVIALRWHGGAEKPLDRAFGAALEVWIAGLASRLAPQRRQP
jgi:TetR/AcrR family tetracycline transcriptional repressor